MNESKSHALAEALKFEIKSVELSLERVRKLNEVPNPIFEGEASPFEKMEDEMVELLEKLKSKLASLS